MDALETRVQACARRSSAVEFPTPEIRNLKSGVESAKQCAKASLLEVMVACCRFRQLAIHHDHEGCAVGERPVFVRPIEIQIQRTPKQPGIGQDDFNARVTGDALVKFLEEVPFAASGQRVCNFGDDPGGS